MRNVKGMVPKFLNNVKKKMKYFLDLGDRASVSSYRSNAERKRRKFMKTINEQ